MGGIHFLQNVAVLPFGRRTDIRHETVCSCSNWFETLFAGNIVMIRRLPPYRGL